MTTDEKTAINAVEKKPYEKYSSGGNMVKAKDFLALSSWVADLKKDGKINKYLEENDDGYHSFDQMLGLCAGFGGTTEEKQIVFLLINEGAKVDICNKNEETIFMTAASNNKIEMMQFLKDRGANINHLDGGLKRTCYHAASNNAPDALEWLVQNGLNLDKKDLLGRTPYHYAAYGCAELACARLVKLGSDPSLEDMEGVLPLEMISKGSDWQPLYRMMEHHYQLNKKDEASQQARDNLVKGFLGWLSALGQKIDDTPEVKYATPEDKFAAEKLKIETEGVPFGWSSEGNIFGYFASTENYAFVRSSADKYYTINHVNVDENVVWQNDGAMIDEKVLAALPQVIEIPKTEAKALRVAILAFYSASASESVEPEDVDFAILENLITETIEQVNLKSIKKVKTIKLKP